MSDIELVLNSIRLNSIMLSKVHKKRYLELKDSLKYYRIPVIVLASINSIVSVSQQYIEQRLITGINSLLSLITGILGSVELFLGITMQMENELNSSKDYYVIATDIYKILSLAPENRNLDMRTFLDDVYNRYIKLLESSCIVHKRIEDKLCAMEPMVHDVSDVGSGSDITDENKLLNNNSLENIV